MTTNSEAVEMIKRGEPITCTRELYDPPAGIGMRGFLFLFAEQRKSVGDTDAYGMTMMELARLDLEFSVGIFDPDANPDEIAAALADSDEHQDPPPEPAPLNEQPPDYQEPDPPPTVVEHPGRRGAVLLLDEMVLHHLLHLPQGVRVLGVSYDHVRRAIVVGVESEKLGEVAWGAELPVMWNLRLEVQPDGRRTITWPDLEDSEPMILDSASKE